MRISFDAAAFSRELKASCDYDFRRFDQVVDDEVKAGTDGMKADVRRETEALLGQKVANAWAGRFYPNKGDARGPAGFVWSKAPKILDFFSSSKLVTPIGEAFAIPTDNVPRGSRGRRLTPIEVEARFNTELQPVKLRSGRIGLVMDLIKARSARRPGLRAATKRRLAQGRQSRPVLMFVLRRGPLMARRLINLQGIADRWGARTAANIEKRLERGI